MFKMPPALLALALCAFSIGTTELVIVGLLPEVASDLEVTIPTAGLLVTGYALGVVFGGPALTDATLRLPRKRLLLALMCVFTVGNVLAAVAPGYAALMAGRVVSALAHGAFFGVAIAVTARLVPAERRGSAIGLVVTGLTVSTMTGVPLGTLLGQRLGWEAAFWMVAALGAAGALGIAFLVPRERDGSPPELGAELVAISRPQVLLSLGLTAVGFGGVFTSFTYVAPLLRDVGGFSPGAVSASLVLVGAGSVVGTLVGGNLADRRLDLTLGGSFAALAVVLVAFNFTIHGQALAVVTVFVFGVVGYAAMPGLQLRILKKAGDAPTLSATITASAFNVGNAGGAFLGGVVIDAGLGLEAVNWAGALVATSGVLVTVLAVVLDRRASASGTENSEGRQESEQACGEYGEQPCA
jgi:DHA1 family inner membrane transport protein